MSDSPRTLSEKVWDRHVVHRGTDGEPDVLFVDLHLIHEVTSPQAFDGLRMAGRPVHRPDLTVATADHNVPTTDIDKPVADPVSAKQLDVLAANCAEFGITCYPMGDANQGIVHIIGPEQGLTQPGMTIVCGDSHTSTHGAFGALAFGIGTSEVEHVLATQTLPQVRPATMAVDVDGALPEGVTAKDLVLAVIGTIGTGGGSGHVIEYRGSAVRGLSMEGRMTVCNMSIEAGARAGMVAPDDITFAYLEGRDHAPKGAEWEEALASWRSLPTDDGATFAKQVVPRRRRRSRRTSPGAPTPHRWHGSTGWSPMPTPSPIQPSETRLLAPSTTWGSPPASLCVRSRSTPSSSARAPTRGSRTFARRPPCCAGRRVRSGLRALVVPGSHRVKAQAEAEGLDQVFVSAGFDWREPGCSMCLAMNPDKLAPGERAASTSNRNFEGRQGRGGRTHLVSPAVAAATAVAGHIADPSELG